MEKEFKKIIGVLLIIGLNWSAISAIHRTCAYFNDVEKSENNILTAGTLDFYLEGKGFNIYDFSQFQTQNERIKLVNNEDNLDFKYSVLTNITNNSGNSDFCDNLVLSVFLNENIVYEGSINEFYKLNIEAPISGNFDQWDFQITGQNSINGICKFDFLFQAQQENLNYGEGFFDNEKVSNYISTGVTDCGAADHIVINEVQAAGMTATDEFVELYNPTNVEKDISGWKLQSKTDIGGSWINRTGSSGLPSNSKIGPHSFFLLASNSYNGSVAPDYKHSANWGLKDSAGHARIIIDDNGINEIDKVGYGATADSAEASNPAPNPPGNKSIERGLTGYDTDNNLEDFIIKTNPTPTNSSGDGMPKIVINEFLATGEYFDDFVEIYNNSDFDIPLGGWTIKIESNNSTHTSYLEGEIKSKDWMLVKYTDENILQADGVITLYNDEDEEIDKISYHNASAVDSSFARIPDGSPNWVDPVPTPGRENITPENLALAGLSQEEAEETVEKAADAVVDEVAEEIVEETAEEISVVVDKKTVETVEETDEEEVVEKIGDEADEEISAAVEEEDEETAEEIAEEVPAVVVEEEAIDEIIDEGIKEETGEETVEEIPATVEEVVEEPPVSFFEETAEKTGEETVEETLAVVEETAEKTIEEIVVVDEETNEEETVEETVEETPVVEEIVEETGGNDSQNSDDVVDDSGSAIKDDNILTTEEPDPLDEG